MSRTNLFRWSGLANIVAGVLTALFWFVHPGLDDPRNALLGRWMYVNTGFITLIVLLLWGLTGLYLRQVERSGLLGFLGYVLGFIGLALFVGLGTFDAYVVPVLTADASSLLGDTGALMQGALGKYAPITGLTFALGYVLFGIATFRAGVFPRWAAVLLALSAPILGMSPLMPAAVRLVGCIIYGVANIALGYSLWSAPSAPAAAR
ncbi:MAG TPA: hypothetical protein VGG03_04365 [Thermoanaerobaculia bacterium]|jgi:hypothetical protein